MADGHSSAVPRRPSPGAPAPDLAEVLSDDALVEAIGKGELSASDAPDDVVALLVAWRDDIDHHPVPDRPTLAEAARALQGAPRRSWWMTRRTAAPLAAAAVVGLALVGIGVGAHQSTPGDPLWGVSQTLFVAHSRSVQAAVLVSADLSQAQAALDAGSATKAMASLDAAKRQLTDVDSAQGRQALERKHSELVAEAGARLGKTSPVPPTPAPSPGPGSVSTKAAPSAPPDPGTSAAVTGSPGASVAATTATRPPTAAVAPPTSSTAPTTSTAPTSSAAPTTSTAPTSSAASTTSTAPTSSAAPTTSAGPNTTVGANPEPTPDGGSDGAPTVAPAGVAAGGAGDPPGAVAPR
ncbi:MAG: anti-sigma-D factor RsdA [Mycobacteriaceae bacterium]